MSTILLRGARQLVTLRGPEAPRRGRALQDLGILENGAALIRDGRIEDLGQGRRVENLSAARGAQEIDVTGQVVTPGFVDCHTHLPWALVRAAVDGGHRGRGHPPDRAAVTHSILTCAQALREVPATTLEHRARRHLAAFIRHGTTTLEAQSGGLDSTSDLKALRVLGRLATGPLGVTATYGGAHTPPEDHDGRPHDYLEWAVSEMLPLLRRRGLARGVDIWCGRGAFPLEDARRYLQAARSAGLVLRVHSEQFSHDGGARLAAELDAASASGLHFADREDIATLAQSGTAAILTPGMTYHLGMDRFAPARALVDHGAVIALATDFSPVTSSTCSMQMVLSLACTHMHLTAAEALAAATINGAFALGCADRVGSIEQAKDADLVVFDVPDYREIPSGFGVNLVSMTIKKGKVLYRRGEVSWPDR
ncbi:MAG: imidazolonepropionase [Bryobacterales bacterium]|nr:imidazolonepropionase [Bryobacterales bacterium]